MRTRLRTRTRARIRAQRRARTRRRRLQGARSLHPRAGLTIVEIIVAILILAVGVLGLASTAAVVQKQMSSGERQSAAATIAQGRFDALTSVNCHTLTVAGTKGTQSHRGGQVREAWFVTDLPNVKQITDTIKITGIKNPLVYTTSVPCRT